MRKIFLVVFLLVLSLTVVSMPRASASVGTPLYVACPVTYDGGGTGPICNCVIHCGNNMYWGGTVPSDACSAIFLACCNGWGNASCS